MWLCVCIGYVCALNVCVLWVFGEVSMNSVMPAHFRCTQ